MGRLADMKQSSIAPRLGIVVVSYNTCALLRRCLQSTADVSLPVEVVVVDNASADGSPAMVRDEFPGVRLIANHDNRGFAAATNQGIEAVRQGTDFVLLLNPDAWLCDGAAEELAGFLLVHPRVGIAGARLLYPDGRPQEGAWRFPTLLMAFFDLFPPRGPLLGRLQSSYLNGRYQEERDDVPFPIDHPLGAAMMIRRETLADVGLFDEGYWMYAEEVDWCRRCREAGWAIWQVPAARVVHAGGASSSQFRGRSFVALHRSRLRYVRRWNDARHVRRYGRIIRLGMLWATLRTWRRWARGGASAAELRAQLLAYGMVMRLTRTTGA
jgi:N-acetylglucosaminyl-diphospho-decaprenol L-rhamnosyltransferase